MADPTEAAPWIQSGGLLAFAGAVLYQVRAMVHAISRIDANIARLEERTRSNKSRRERYKRESGSDETITLPIKKTRARTYRESEGEDNGL